MDDKELGCGGVVWFICLKNWTSDGVFITRK